MSPILTIQRRMMELGRVRLGQKGTKGEPKRLDTFRFTSASKGLLDAVAQAYGGTVQEWASAPDEGYFEIITEATELNIVLPPVFSQADGTPTTSYSQWYELWSAAGCQRRCDGVTEALSGEACMCNPDERECQVTTRVSFMLPEIPGLGVWRLDSKGINAAIELPGTLEILMMAAHERTFIPAVLRIEHRTAKKPGEQTKRFVVPVIDLPQLRMGELLAGAPQQAINAPAPPPPRAALPPHSPDLPADPAFGKDDDGPGFGEPPEPETFGDPAAAAMTAKLYGLADQLGSRLVTENAVEKNRETASPGKHLEWLARQVAKAEEKVAGGVVA